MYLPVPRSLQNGITPSMGLTQLTAMTRSLLATWGPLWSTSQRLIVPSPPPLLALNVRNLCLLISIANTNLRQKHRVQDLRRRSRCQRCMGCNPPCQQQGQGRRYHPQVHSLRELPPPCGADRAPRRIVIPGCPVLHGVCTNQRHWWRVCIARYRVLPRRLRWLRSRSQNQREFRPFSDLPPASRKMADNTSRSTTLL